MITITSDDISIYSIFSDDNYLWYPVNITRIIYMMGCAIWYHLYGLKNMKNTLALVDWYCVDSGVVTVRGTVYFFVSNCRGSNEMHLGGLSL